MALPDWGPYSDRSVGVSHIPAANNGIRFDVAVQPSLYFRNLTPLANVKRESGYHPWRATPDLSYYSYRFELEWKDRVFCDVAVCKVDERSRLIKAEFVNNTGSNRSLALNIFSSITYPYERKVAAVLPAMVEWYRAPDYQQFLESVKPWNYNLVYDGQLRGQVRDESSVSNTAIICGRNGKGTLIYKVSNNRRLKNGVIVIRAKAISGSGAILQPVVNRRLLKPITIQRSDGYSIAEIDVDDLPNGDFDFSLETMNNTICRIDGFVLVKRTEISSINFVDQQLNFTPKQIEQVLPNAAVLKFDDIKEYYGIVWDDHSAEERELSDDNPDKVLSIFNHLVRSEKENVKPTRIGGNGKGWFKNIFSAPIKIKPGQRASRYVYIVSGFSKIEVINKLRSFDRRWEDGQRLLEKESDALSHRSINRAGIPYQFSLQLLEATTLTNLLYPTFTVNQYVKHTTPGKKWSSLYTWDSGFIGLGYCALNMGRALESLNAYTMDSKEQSAFLEHGTPLPVQAYLYNELWNKTQNPEYLSYFYPRLKRYYEFLGGAENSPTRKLQSNLLSTWDIFYNSGGWDDYSPQVFVHQNKLERLVAPTINTAHQIRFAKLLRMAAWQLGRNRDMEQYNSDINIYSQALQENAWDEDAGYYGYVEHDQNGRAKGLLKFRDGKNFNMGLDGCSPLIAGICTSGQQKKILDNLFSPGKLWTDQGITAIDQSAPYYNKDGYWNGRVWMPHQWFFWKTMLDLNEPEKAIKIAQTALDVWKRETEDSYNCWENFSVETGNGGGWHQFGALSSPVLNWFSALFRPGTITYGYNIWPLAQKLGADNASFVAKFKLFDEGNKRTSMLICLNDKHVYQARCNGEKVDLQKISDGLYIIRIQLTESEKDVFSLEVTKAL